VLIAGEQISEHDPNSDADAQVIELAAAPCERARQAAFDTLRVLGCPLPDL
jgi:hypothetical protein